MDLGFVRDFLQTLADNLSPVSPDKIRGFPSFMHQDEGSLFLSDEEAQQYRRTVTRLNRILAPEEDLSESTINAALRGAVFESLDLQGRRGGDFASRLDAAVDKIATLASLSVEDYDCLVEVCGLDTKALPARFGSVRFVHFNQYQLRKLRRSALPAGHRDAERRRFVHDTTDRLSDHCFGIARVRARDAEAARALATRRVRGTMDCVNFFTDMVPYNHGWLFLPGERERRPTMSAAIKPDGSLWCNTSRTHPIGLFSFGKLRRVRRLRSTVTRVTGSLREQRDPVEELLLTSVQIAGRATITRRSEDSFLLYAIALESLVLPQVAGELTHRLSQRVARLLAGDKHTRIECSKEVKRLYSMRSRIVHSGSHEIDVRDLDAMRIYAKQVILTMLGNAAVAKCKTVRALDEWFEHEAAA